MIPKYKAGDIFKLHGQEVEPNCIRILAVSPTIGDIECEPDDKNNDGCTYCYFVLKTTFHNYMYSVISENFLDVNCCIIVV